ncbi:RNA polymerase sigma factor [Siminovitchia sp. FSL H7-0308]|uniref:RNA polymerase sigma factor n=1 Tax=Siminovitchia sp. FSL H7-0308 TaxID=2921432 RepID=UPI0030ED57F9
MNSNKEIRLEDGRVETIESIYQVYRDPLYRFVYRYSGDQQLSIDIVQDIFEKLIKKQQYSPEKGRFKTYLFQIAYNTMITKLKRRQKLRTLLPFLASERPTAISIEEKMSVQKAVQRLPEEQRAVILLTYYHDLSQKEIATILEVPVGTVKSRIHHAIKKLKEELEVDGDER